MGATDVSPPRSAWLPGVEGLRALAACAIVVLHVWEVPASRAGVPQTGWLPLFVRPLEEGVPLFFVLSGFLLWRPIASAVLCGRRLPSVRRYARNRALRILPAYWVVLLATALVLQSGQLTPVAHGRFYGAIHSPLLLAKNALLLQNYAPSTFSSGVSPAWSLAVELVFYALLPLLALLAARRATRRASLRPRVAAALAPAGLLLVVGLFGKLLATFAVPGREQVVSATWHAVIDWSFLTHADLFAFGMAVAVLRALHEDGRLSRFARVRPAVDRVLVYTAIPFLIFGFVLIPHDVFEPVFSLLCALLLARVVLVPLGGPPGGLVRALERRPIVAAGKASYSIFLWNYPVMAFLAEQGLTVRASSAWYLPANLAIAAPIIAALSAATYLGIERPAMRLRGLSRRPVEQPSIAAVAPLGSA
jgi:peptidoglycan/LPS O-acetylase OafA/YrhL